MNCFHRSSGWPIAKRNLHPILNHPNLVHRDFGYEPVLALSTLPFRGMSVVYGLEDVGGYGRGLAVYLTDNGCSVKEVNAKLETVDVRVT